MAEFTTLLSDVEKLVAFLNDLEESFEARMYASVKPAWSGGSNEPIEIVPGLHLSIADVTFYRDRGLVFYVKVDDEDRQASMTVDDLQDLVGFEELATKGLLKGGATMGLRDLSEALVSTVGNRKLMEDKVNRVIDGSLSIEDSARVTPSERKYYDFYSNDDDVGSLW